MDKIQRNTTVEKFYDQLDTLFENAEEKIDKILENENIARTITISQATPQGGKDGDIWIGYDIGEEAIQDGIQVDYIVKQGTDGIWTYRQWNSGVAECWGNLVRETVSCTTLWPVDNGTCTLYYAPVEKPLLPKINNQNLFIGTPTMTVSMQHDNAWLINGTHYYVITPKGNNAVLNNIEFHIQVIGRWK